jgi:hypothetical protein
MVLRKPAKWFLFAKAIGIMISKAISHYKILEKLGEGGMPSFGEKYNKLVPQGGRRGLQSRGHEAQSRRAG